MIGKMRNPDVQNLLEAFASLKRGLQCNIRLRIRSPHRPENDALLSNVLWPVGPVLG